MLFGNREQHSYYDDVYSCAEISATVFQDMTGKKSLSINSIINEISSGYYPGCPEFSDYYTYDLNETQEERDKKFEEYDKNFKEGAKKQAKKFYNNNKGQLFFKFHYSDSDGEYASMLEHSGIFDSLPYIQISHH